MVNELFVCLDQIYRMTAIPVRVIDESGEIILYQRGFEQSRDPVNFRDLKKELCRKAKNSRYPFAEIGKDIGAYGVVHDILDATIILGPVMLYKMNRSEINQFGILHGLSDGEMPVSRSTMEELTATLILFYYLRTNEIINEEKITGIVISESESQEIAERDNSQYIMQEAEDEHMGYLAELKYMKRIRDGDVESFLEDQKASKTINQVGRFARNSYKNYEYMICSATTLVTRAAIEGGLEANVAYAMCEMYLFRLEACRTINEIIEVHHKMQLAFVKQVRKRKDEKSSFSYVEQCKKYISNHLKETFTLTEIADYLGINQSYLARKFKLEVGMTVMNYARIKKLDAAANMLKYSRESIGDISYYLGFSTQSYFGALFKAYTGFTPQQFRNREQVTD